MSWGNKNETRSLLPENDENYTPLTDERKKRVSTKSGHSTRKLKHMPELYYVWFVANQLLNQYGHLPKRISEDWKLKDYPLPKDWKHRDDVLQVCENFLETEGYRLFGEKIGQKVSAIISPEYLRWEPQEEILIKVPLNSSKTIQQRMNEIHKLLQRVSVFTGKYKDQYPHLEGCDWDLKKKRKTSKYQITKERPKAGYYWEIVMFLKHYLENGVVRYERIKKIDKKTGKPVLDTNGRDIYEEYHYDPPKVLYNLDGIKEKLRGLTYMREYFGEHEETYWKMPYFERGEGRRGKTVVKTRRGDQDRYQEKFMGRFRDDVVKFVAGLLKSTFPE